MSEDVYSQMIRGLVTESAFGTLTEGSAIMTGASVNRIQGQNIAMELRAVNVQCSFPEDLPGSGATELVSFTISTRSGLTAMPSIDEEHVVYATQISVRAGVAVYLPLIVSYNEKMPAYVEFTKPFLISHTKLYPYILSTNSSTAAKAYYVLIYTYVLLDADMAIEALEAFR